MDIENDNAIAIKKIPSKTESNGFKNIIIYSYFFFYRDNNTRREETTLTQLYIRHTRLTHSFILKEEPPPKCLCGNQYSIKHILIECTKLNHTRKKFYKANNMKELF